jgi:23S rRNA (guanine745-N1)-methyltransferase
MVCARGHAYDIARSGYLNLLQPQDRRSLSAGDSRAAVEARARLLAQHIGQPLVDAVSARVVTALGATPAGAVVADLGSGSGELLASVAARAPVDAIGIDLSTAAAEHAARRYPGVTWVVANADRRLPLLDRSVDVLVSVHGRRNPPECARVLTKGGHLIVAVPAADDLTELRAHVQGQAVERERVDALIAAHRDRFGLVDRVMVRDRQRVSAEALRDLLRGTYRGARLSAAGRMATLESLDVTFASEVMVFAVTR